MNSKPSSSTPSDLNVTAKSKQVSRYSQRLAALSARTGTPLPSLAISFAILHEFTAIAPVIGFYYAFRSLGTGDTVASYVKSVNRRSEGNQIDNWKGAALAKAGEYMEEGEATALRFARRYELWGMEKNSILPDQQSELRRRVVGDLANAALAYGVTKVRVIYYYVQGDWDDQLV